MPWLQYIHTKHHLVLLG